MEITSHFSIFVLMCIMLVTSPYCCSASYKEPYRTHFENQHSLTIPSVIKKDGSDFKFNLVENPVDSCEHDNLQEDNPCYDPFPDFVPPDYDESDFNQTDVPINMTDCRPLQHAYQYAQ